MDLGVCFHLHMRNDHASVIICKGMSGFGFFIRFGLIFNNSPSFR